MDQQIPKLRRKYSLNFTSECLKLIDTRRPSVKPTLEMVLQRVHPDDIVLAQRIIANASSGTDFEETFRLLMPTGTIKQIHVRAHPHRDNSGQIEFIGAVTDLTERKTRDDKIRRLVDAGILGIFIANLEGEIVEANQAFLAMLQHDREDVLAGLLRWVELTPPELHERDKRAITEALSNGFFQTYEKEFFRKDGSRVPVLLGGALFPGANEGVAFALDLTEQKRAEGALRKSEAYLAEAQRLSKTGSWAWNPASDNTYYSEECYRLLGFEPVGPPPTLEAVIQRIHPDDQAFCRERVEKGVGDKVDFELDYRIVHPDERVRDIHCVCHPVLDRYGELVELIGTVIDVTEPKAADKKIRAQEVQFQQMLDLLPHQVSVFGPGGERLYANRVSLDYIGFSLEEWRQTPGGFFRPGSFIHPDDCERAVRAYGDCGGAAYSFELRVRGADGKYRWFLLHCSPVHDDKGQIKRWLLASVNIDERKRAEEKLQEENVALREEIDKASMFEEIVGTSAPLKKVVSRISRVAPTESGVLITGETGTGKELVARAIHRLSHRSQYPFVTVNCAAIPRDLIASELFGHEKGAFTGATARRSGRFELATRGTIFLDEVGELPIETQIALLRVLQEHEFERVGGTGPIQTDVRVLAATNRDLEAAIATGMFRSDLFYRLNIFPIDMPPLRERREDIPLLVEYFLDRYARKAGKTFKTVDRKSLELLQSYSWPGNIRELQNVIERSVIVSEAETFSVDGSWLSRQAPSQPRQSHPDLSRRPASTEKKFIEAALRECGGRVSGPSGAAVRLGIPGSTLESKIKALKVNKNRFRAR
ncbi:MAG TPA: sigma 54-interacting transcriptional regulator [Bryobacteraceae bacterium]